MRLTIDATPLLVRSAGVKNYLYYWLRSLRSLAGDSAVKTFPVNLHSEALDHEGSVAGSAATVAGLARLHLANHFRFPLVDGLGARCDVFHASWLLRRPPHRSKLTATLYDLTCWLMPEVHTAANVKAARRFAELMLRRADGLIAISEHTRHDAVRVLGLAPEKIAVIRPGVADAFFEVAAEAVDRVRARYGLGSPYALFVGTIEPRKNVARLLEAWQTLRPDLREHHQLVVAGPAGWDQGSLVRRLQTGLPGVRYLGYVPESELPALTAGATAFVYPSLYEGFGLPVAQAMAAGVAVVTSAVSSLPEVGGDAVLLVDPLSVTDLRNAMERLLESPSLRSRLGALGRRRAELFRWDRVARQSWEFFQRIAGQ